MKAGDIATTAARLVTIDRAGQHGDFGKNHANIASLWNAYLGNRPDWEAPLEPYEVASMMALLKIARTQLGAVNDDDAVDACGYLAIAGELLGRDDSLTRAA